MRFLVNLLLTTIAVYTLGSVLGGVSVASFGTALVVATLLRVANATLRPLLFILTLPINVLTLGLFSFIVMGAMVWVVSRLVSGFVIVNFGWCIIFATLLVVLNSFLKLFTKKNPRTVR